MGSLALSTGQQAQPDHRDRIIASLEQENRDLKERLREAQDESQRANAVAKNSVAELQRQLQPMYTALRMVFGEIEKVAPGGSSGMGGTVTQSGGVWESWKQKLGGQKAKCIDAFLAHGALTQTQLRVIVGCATSSVPGLISDLRQLGLLDKNGSKFSLKEL